MTENSGEIKQIACGRRKPNMTRKEYHDYRFRVHGALSAYGEASPHIYIQTPIFDAAFGARAGGLNLNHAWVGRDDVSELTFRNWAHLQQVFSSEWVKTTVGPDGVHFADIDTAIALLAVQEPVQFPHIVEPTSEDGYATVAMYFLSTPDNKREGRATQSKVQSLLIQALEENAGGEVYKAEANVGITSSKFDLAAYFGGGTTPQYCLVYKLFLKSVASIPYIRKAQKYFESFVGDELDFASSYIVFGKEGVVIDHSKGVSFDETRQPAFNETEYFNAISHLDLD